MKKNYEKLQIEVIVFEKKDIITASAIVAKEHDNSYVNFDRFFTT